MVDLDVENRNFEQVNAFLSSVQSPFMYDIEDELPTKRALIHAKGIGFSLTSYVARGELSNDELDYVLAIATHANYQTTGAISGYKSASIGDVSYTRQENQSDVIMLMLSGLIKPASSGVAVGIVP